MPYYFYVCLDKDYGRPTLLTIAHGHSRACRQFVEAAMQLAGGKLQSLICDPHPQQVKRLQELTEQQQAIAHQLELFALPDILNQKYASPADYTRSSPFWVQQRWETPAHLRLLLDAADTHANGWLFLEQINIKAGNGSKWTDGVNYLTVLTLNQAGISQLTINGKQAAWSLPNGGKAYLWHTYTAYYALVDDSGQAIGHTIANSPQEAAERLERHYTSTACTVQPLSTLSQQQQNQARQKFLA